jgi:hypothetical protein
MEGAFGGYESLISLCYMRSDIPFCLTGFVRRRLLFRFSIDPYISCFSFFYALLSITCICFSSSYGSASWVSGEMFPCLHSSCAAYWFIAALMREQKASIGSRSVLTGFSVK